MLTINNRDKMEWFEGITVRDVLNKMGYTYNLITVSVNNTVIPEEEYDIYEIEENSNIMVFHLAHGG